ncbi:magnesium transporter [Pediococcus ethanolidurans]|uniref:Magnesium transporter MgtE n=1 Tax=Pediococcus ethanolidurans TaxID=319653 RepID=A0A0R2K2K5_9LACO|nr:magnesium transporter [Pediococcus ethanolidurans]KRN82070.1 Mg2+ transporter [Pediococcus ethanolidurans]GEN95601.1 magnesium transporter MgtE [Pediococcus ethanolidurans]SER75564.1 magnesium transporter [Pediococcus ethanolidurans]
MAEELDQIELEIVTLLNKHAKKKFRNLFLSLHGYEQSQIFAKLDLNQRKISYALLTPKELANVFDDTEEDPVETAKYLEEMDSQYAARLLTEMYTDNVVDILSGMRPIKQRKYLNLLHGDEAKQVRDLIHYEDETAGSLMTTEYIKVTDEQTIGSAMQQVKREAQEAELVTYIYVVNKQNILVGVLSVRDLITHGDEEKVANVMTTRVLAVDVNEDQEAIAEQVRDYNFVAIPVVNQTEELLGIITVDDIIDVIDEESAEDYSRLAGVDTESVTRNPFQTALKRLPWLITLLFLGMLTATLINHFEGLLSEVSVLAIFISLITGTAGNAGTQSLAVAVRRLATNSHLKIWRLILNEIATGIIIGIITGLCVWLMVGLWKQNLLLGGVVGAAMASAIFVANLAGSLIPIGMEKLGVDPAVASGPFISTLSDLTSVLIYFNIAQYFLQLFIR